MHRGSTVLAHAVAIKPMFRVVAPTPRLIVAVMAIQLNAHAADAESTTQIAPAAATTQGTPFVVGSDAEQALATRFDNGTLGPQYVRLNSASGPFFARYEPAAIEPAQGAVLIVPGLAQRISDEPVIDALIEEFPRAGWAVLAIQPKLLPAAAAIETYTALDGQTQERIAQACARLATDGLTNIVVLGLESGATSARRFLAEDPTATAVTGFATRGLWQGEVTEIGRPVIEFIGETDRAAARLGEVRQRLARREDSPYRRFDFAGIGRDFTGFEAEMARRLRGWIKSTVANPSLSSEQ